MKKERLFKKDFTLVVIGQIISLFGNAVLRFALPLYLLRETGSAALFGLVTACAFLPMIFLSFLGGVMADRVNKQRIMVILDFLTAGIILTMSFLLGKAPLVPLLLVVLMLLYGISGTYQPAVQASIPALVAEAHILPAVTIVNQIGQLAGLLGPIVGGILFGTFGIGVILRISFFCFFASAVMELFIRIPFQKRKAAGSIAAIVKNDLRDSVCYIRNEKPVLIQMIGLIAIFNLLLISVMMVGVPVVIVDVLGLSDKMLGFAQGISAIGGLCGGAFISVFSGKFKLSGADKLFLFCSSCVGVMAVPLILGATPVACYVLMTGIIFLFMGAGTMFSVQMLATVQRETPAELIGKVIALLTALSMIAQPIGQVLYGVAFEKFADGGGVIFLIVSFLSTWISMQSKKVFQKY